MASNRDADLDPQAIENVEFSNSFRGYDQAEVRQFLRLLAGRLKERDVEQVASSDESDQLLGQIERLEDSLSDANDRLETLASAPDPSASVSIEDLDDEQITSLLGDETVRVLNSAKQAATEIKARAETKSIEAVATAEARLAEAESFKAATIEESHQKAAEIVDESNLAAQGTRETAQAELEEAKREAESVRAEVAEEVAAIRQEAADEAVSIREEAAADSVAAADAAREHARQMLVEAQSIREKVLSDLVVKRRNARQQLDGVKAARDRLSRSLFDVRSEVDKATTELGLAIPEARLALESFTRRNSAAEDQADVSALATQLDNDLPAPSVARSRHAISETREESKPLPEVETFIEDEAGAVVGVEVESGLGVTAEPEEWEEPEDVYSDSDDESELTSKDESIEEAETELDDESHQDGLASDSEGNDLADDSRTNGDSNADHDSVLDTADTEFPDVEDNGDSLDDLFARMRNRSSVSESLVEPAPLEVEEDEIEPTAEEVTAGITAPNLVSESAEHPTASEDTSSEDDLSEEMVSEEPDEDSEEETSGSDTRPEFLDRDVALTRLGPDVRRLVKRAFADDLSDLLERVRTGTGDPSADELPSTESLKGLVRSALEEGLVKASVRGSNSNGSDSGCDVSGLVDRLADDLVDPFRLRVEQILARSVGDREELLDPFRSLYRDVRSNELSQTADDGLAEAYALGLFSTIDDGDSVIWVTDSRAETGADCHDNTLAGEVAKGADFPTGHIYPLAEPGCRCLVLPA